MPLVACCARRRARGRRAPVAPVLAILVCLSADARADGGTSDAAYDDAVHALAARIEQLPANAALAKRVETRVELVRADPEAATRAIRAALDAHRIVPVRVPGLFYRSHPWTGADLSRIETSLGTPILLVPSGEIDPVSSNAAIVRDALREVTRDGDRVLLFSVSKGSADAQEALRQDPVLGRRVVVWIDLVGLLEGTPLTDPGRAPEEVAALGLPDDTAQSMSTSARREAARAPLPAQTRAVHVAAFPTLSAISPEARTGFERLRPIGANDGFLLLDTFSRAPGRVLVVRDADHYLRIPDLDLRLTALLSVLLDELPR